MTHTGFRTITNKHVKLKFGEVERRWRIKTQSPILLSKTKHLRLEFRETSKETSSPFWNQSRTGFRSESIVPTKFQRTSLLQLRATRSRPQNFVSRARSMSGPVAKSLREEKRRKRPRKFASVSNERKIEQVKLSLHRQTPFVGNRACCGFRFAKMSLRLQTNDRLDPLEATRCGGPFIHRGRAARKVSPSLRENSRIGRLHGEINSRQPRCTQLSRLDHLVFRVIGLETSPIESFRTTA